ncbi:MAG TPA: hypothetical protein VLM41_03480, partial [Steroidobacteraceae bacterium]|nr:hypothetical protein [Steroidobacteraceae bacterium]
MKEASRPPLPPDVDPCDSPGHDHVLELDEARNRILAAVRPVREHQSIALMAGLGRVLAADVHSSVDVPSHRNSAMDGYALAADELPSDGSRSFAVVGTSWAGRPFEGSVGPGQCVRIMTGATLP